MGEYEVAALECEGEKIGDIEHLDFVTVRLPFLHPFSISKATWTCKEALLVRLEEGAIVAWGECVADPDPYYAYETTSTCAHVIRDFLWPCVEPGMTLGELFGRWALVRGHGMAKAALENALLDLFAKRRGLPLHEELGLPRRRVMSGVSLGIQDSPQALVDAAAEAVDSGYHRIKMKVKRGKDLEYARAVRERFPSLKLMVDANGDYSLTDAERLAELDELGLMMIEQPLSYSDIYQHSKLQRKLRTPICLDESILSLADAAAAVELGAARVINIKQGRVGGLVEAVKIARYCAARGVPAWSGGMDETGIGRAVNIHLQAEPGFSLPGDTAETKRYFPEDIVSPPVTLAEGGFIEIPGGPGIGVEVLPERLDRLTIARARLK